MRLERALADSDLEKKTQAALANRIADREQLESAPKDLVSKVFRELPVDAQTLERVARALGVDAETIYLREPESDTPSEPGKTTVAAPASSRRRRWPWYVLTAIALVAVAIWLPRPTELSCAVRETLLPSRTPIDKFGFVIMRFAEDPENRGQRFLAESLAGDANLAPYASVLVSCETLKWGESGELARELEAVRQKARSKLERMGAHLLLWGRLQDDDLLVRFVSTRADVSPLVIGVGGRPVGIEEARLELRLPLNRPSDAIANLKKLALDLLDTSEQDLLTRRDEARRAYSSSMDWLRAAVVSQRNLLRMIDPSSDPRRWAMVNAQLCYEHRLLGDYESDSSQYELALEACDQSLLSRPRDKFPRDWAAAQINKASALIRLHYYAGDREQAVARLKAAEEALVAAGGGIDQRLTPQLWVVRQRNLGTTYLRLGELTGGDESASYFDRGVAMLQEALDAQDVDYQPLDWAITQQNICLALYQHGLRLGADGVDLVREARSRCELAQQQLSPVEDSLNWAMVQNNLAVATAILAQLDGDNEGLRQAIAAFRRAQDVYSRDRLPAKWAEVELNLGELHCNLARLADDAGAMEQAAAHTEGALEVFLDTGNRLYRDYAESLLARIRDCDLDAPSDCVCD